jgi:hypothetical protein
MSAPLIGLLPGGLPGPLPKGERILWQGRPRWRTVALRVTHVRKLAIYFGALLLWYVVSKLAGGMDLHELAVNTAKLFGVALAPLALLSGYAWAVERTTVYTITSRRVLIKFGVGLSMTINLPFSKIDGAALRLAPDGTGDISLAIARDQRVSYVIQWPHVRSWYWGRTQPSLRSVPDAERAAQVLGRALAASAEAAVQPAPVVRPRVAAAGGRAAATA